MSNVNMNTNVPVGGLQETPDATDGKKPITPSNDMGGVTGGGNKQLFGRPNIPAPTLSAAAMMVALTALNSKMTEESISFGEKTLEGVRQDIKSQSNKRLEQLKDYFDNMDQISSKKKCGFFGAIVNFFKKALSGDIAGAFKDIADNIGTILKDVLQMVAVAVAVLAAVALTAVSGGAGAALIAVVVVAAVLMIGSMVMADPVVMEAMVNSLPEDQRQAAGIALAVVAAVLALTGGIMMSAATGGASAFATVSTVVSILSTLTDAGVTIQQGVDGYKQSNFKADAMLSQAEMDRSDAKMTDLKGILDRNQKDLKALFDSFAKILESTREMVNTAGRNLNRAASV